MIKKTAVVGLTASAIGILIGINLPKRIIQKPISITTFKINVPFDQWARGFDSKGSNKMHKENNIKPLFRGVNNNDSTQVIVIHQSEPVTVETVLSENKKMIEASGHIMRTTDISNWLFQ